MIKYKLTGINSVVIIENWNSKYKVCCWGWGGGGRTGWRGIRKEEQKVYFINLFLFSSKATPEIKYLLLRKGNNVWIMNKIRGPHIKELQIKQLPSSKQVPLRTWITMEFVSYYPWLHKVIWCSWEEGQDFIFFRNAGNYFYADHNFLRYEENKIPL